MSVNAAQRYTRSRTCPICGGFDQTPRGQGARCFGFLSEDGEWAHCTREEQAGRAPFNANSETYAHLLKGDCNCGVRHDPRPPSPNGAQPEARIVTTHDYQEEEGGLLYQEVRYEPKSFKVRRPDGKGGWIWRLGSVRRVLYNLPALVKAELGETAYVPEGAKDVDRLTAEGVLATTNALGAKKWRDEYSESLEGRNVVILPDNDDDGRAHADQVAHSLLGTASTIKVLELPGLPEKGDVSDWLDSGHTVDELKQLADETPPWEPWASDGEPPGDAAAPQTTCLADVQREEVEWRWDRRIPQGKLVLLAGDPGVGKSFLAAAIGTAYTTGAALPGDSDRHEPASVLILSAEDGLADTLRPRLEDMGADLRRVTVLTAIRDAQGNDRHVDLTTDIVHLETVLSRGGYGLVIIDPLTAYLGGSLSTQTTAGLRAVLTPLAMLAERFGVAVIGNTHLRKSSGDRALYRVIESISFTAAARVVHLVGIDPDNEHKRIMATIKCNLAPLAASISFEITEGRFLWGEESDVTVDALLGPDRTDEERSALEEAKAFLPDVLADGPRPAKEVEAEAHEAGISLPTLKRARAALGVRAIREQTGYGGERGRWLLELPHDQAPQEDQGVHIGKVIPLWRRESGESDGLPEGDPLVKSETVELDGAPLGPPPEERGS